MLLVSINLQAIVDRMAVDCFGNDAEKEDALFICSNTDLIDVPLFDKETMAHYLIQLVVNYTYDNLNRDDWGNTMNALKEAVYYQLDGPGV